VEIDSIRIELLAGWIMTTIIDFRHDELMNIQCITGF
jgi:hypothetical protein